jgi:hypothetical protein
MISYKDNILATTTTTGTGTLTQATAVTGYSLPVSGDDAKVFVVMIKAVDGNGIPTGAWELTESTYTHSGTTWSRGTLIDSSTGSRIDFAAGAKHIAVVMPSREIIDPNIRQAEISVTGATTATIGRYHVCSGTSADYTVTLPAASGNAGRTITIRMASGLTKLVTIDGNSTELIDGLQTRVMWAGESATLLCDGTGWSKISGKSIAIVQRAVNSSSGGGVQTITTATMTIVNLVTATDNPVGMVDVANDRIYAPRSSAYNIAGSIVYLSAFTAPRVLVRIFKNGDELFGSEVGVGNVNSYAAPSCGGTLSLTTGDYVDLRTYQDSGGDGSLSGLSLNVLTVTEVLQW